MASIPAGMDRAMVTRKFKVRGRLFIGIQYPETRTEMLCSVDHMQNCRGWMIGTAFADVEVPVTVYYNRITGAARISRM